MSAPGASGHASGTEGFASLHCIMLTRCYSITSSEVDSSVAGTSTPIARAVAKLMTNSDLVVGHRLFQQHRPGADVWRCAALARFALQIDPRAYCGGSISRTMVHSYIP
jgi:hypothetical protein